MDTSRVDGVKAPLHTGTPRSLHREAHQIAVLARPPAFPQQLGDGAPPVLYRVVLLQHVAHDVPSKSLEVAPPEDDRKIRHKINVTRNAQETVRDFMFCFYRAFLEADASDNNSVRAGHQVAS